MRPPLRNALIALGVVSVLALAAFVYQSWTPLAVADDPLPRMPGTQPDQGVSLESPNRCLNCHAGYNTEVEPGYNWLGSMMAQSGRDLLFYPAMTVAAQDSIYAIGRPNAADLCERCHFPTGWLEGHSDPTNASAMTGADFDGVQCDFCHRMYDPFFEETYAGLREGSDWLHYWDETDASSTPSTQAAAATYAEDATLAQAIQLFSGLAFYGSDNLPISSSYIESGSGQYFVSSSSQKRASFADAEARHQMYYSRFHKSRYFCNACHDVSNPVLANLGHDGTSPLTTETESAFSYFHVERTFSEFMLSAYGQQGGAAGVGPYSPASFQTSLANNYISRCQDCHMRDVVGAGADKRNVLVRPNESVEHPESGQPLHDLTGGNAWVSYVLASAIPGSPVYDDLNYQLLNQGPAVLTLDLSQGQGIDPQALLAGSERAKQQLLLAASIEGLSYDPASGALSFRVQNQTGHKLISGFPEGRRMFLNIQAFAAGELIFEVNPYDAQAGTLKGLSYPYQGGIPSPQPLSASETHLDQLVYEVAMTSSITGEDETFHIALATGRHKDNRIPPKGFRIADAADRLSDPVYYVNGANVGSAYFTAAEYAGGYDAVSLQIPAGADYVVVKLYYQTTSREYVEFLRDEINGTGNLTLPATSYIVQSDPFFAKLRAWGNTLWQLWTHNMDLPGAAPFLMTEASWGTPSPGCQAPAPTLQSAAPGNQQVTLAWSDEHSADPNVTGYRLYYDQAGKAQLAAELGLVTTYLDDGLTNGQEYCYKVTSLYATCESPFSNLICAIPTNQGQATDPAGVGVVETGIYTGKGKSQTFTPQTTFQVGDGVTIRVYVTDSTTGAPIEGAVVDLLITGPESLTLTTGTSDVDGMAEATWQTKAPGRRNPGTSPGTYDITVKDVQVNGYHWNGIMTSVTIVLQ